MRRSTEASRPKRQTNWRRVDAMTDQQIRKAVKSDPDAAPIVASKLFRRARIVLPEKKQSVSLRLDLDLLSWFRKQGRGYQTRMNAVLRAYMVAQHSPKSS